MNNVRALRSKLVKAIKYGRSSSAEETVAIQVVDLASVKYSGTASGDIIEGDEVSKAIDFLIQGYLWIYHQGYSGLLTFNDTLTDEQSEKYEAIKDAFEVFNNFMRTHMHLVE